jgi:hypothetical protein
MCFCFMFKFNMLRSDLLLLVFKINIFCMQGATRGWWRASCSLLLFSCFFSDMFSNSIFATLFVSSPNFVCNARFDVSRSSNL